MNYRTPHTFDMSDYYTGKTVVVGGRDFEREEKETPKAKNTTENKQTSPIKLDWSFLKTPKVHPRD